jgi:ParB-like chromosome segregation protein Spo0J
MTLRDIATSRGGEVLCIDLSKLTIQEGFNLRQDYGDIDELARQIAEVGQRTPMKIRLSDDHDSAVIIDGHRRMQAIAIANAKYGAKIETAKCIAEERGANEETRIVEMFMSGVGKELTALEQAEAVCRLQGFNWPLDKIAKTIGRSATKVKQLLDLHGSSKELRNAVQKGLMSTTAALELAGAPPEKQKEVLKNLGSAVFTAAKTPKGRVSKKKAVSVQDVKKAVKGIPSTVSSKPIKENMTRVDGIIKAGKNLVFYRGVRYGLELAMTGKAVSDKILAA